MLWLSGGGAVKATGLKLEISGVASTFPSGIAKIMGKVNAAANVTFKKGFKLFVII